MSLDERRYLGRFKIDKSGNVVDLTKMKKTELSSLRDYYRKKYERARSNDMKVAYHETLGAIEEYIYDDKLPSGPDVFYLAYSSGLKDIRSMIKRYLPDRRMKTSEEASHDIFLEKIQSRKFPYDKARLPSDDTLRKMFFLTWKQPPSIEEAIEVFCNDFQIKAPRIETKLPGSIAALYDPVDGVVVISLAKINSPLGLWDLLSRVLFEHLCECKSWTFDPDPQQGLHLQREEAMLYGERTFGRLIKIGLVPPPPNGHKFPDE
jgi:hypothetical protein